MKSLERILKRIEENFKEDRPLGKFYPLFEAIDTFLMTSGKVAKKAPHVRDAVDMKRMMIFVVIALIPCIAMSIYNTGYQILLGKGVSCNLLQCIWLGLLKVMPIVLITYIVGGFWEVLFAISRKHEINEGFLVTGILFALTLPPTIPLWQVAVGISFGVVVGKEIFGGTGMNVLNPALTGRAFLFFAYPVQISGDAVWVAIDGFTQATPLAVVAAADQGGPAIEAITKAGYSLKQMFFGLIPGSMGETSAFACLLGLIFLLITRVASWRVIVGCILGAVTTSLMFYIFYTEKSLTFFSLPPHWHLVMGGFAFGMVFMATDPVSCCATDTGRWIYGVLIGILTILIRVINPAYPEGMMLAILFMNIFAPLIDHFVVETNIKKRLARTRIIIL